MRVSDHSGHRLLALGLVFAIMMGSYGITEGQVQSGFGDTQPPNDTLGKIETWLADARQAISEGDAQKAAQYVQVAETIANQPGATMPDGYSFEPIKNQIANLSGGSAAPATMSGPKDFMPINGAAVDVSNIETAASNTLLKSRQFLALGDVVGASSMLEKAREFQVDYSRLGDSPEIIEEMIKRQNQLVVEMRGSDLENYNQQAGFFLMEQASAMMTYQDFSSAKMLIEQARKFNADFASRGINPDAMLAQIAAATVAPAAGSSFNLTDDGSATTQVVEAPEQTPQQQAMSLMSEAQLAIDQERWEEANAFVQQAKGLNVPDTDFQPGMMRPWQMELVVNDHLNRNTANQLEVEQVQSTTQVDQNRHVIQADYIPENDTSRIVQVAGTEDEGASKTYPEFNPIPSRGMQLYRSGLQAMDNEDDTRAREFFETALQYRDQLDQPTQSAIKAHLVSFQDSGFEALPDQATAFADDQQEMFRRLQNEVFKERSSAERMLQTSPRKALEKMTFVRNRITESGLDNVRKKPLLTIIDRDINEMQGYIDTNLSEILNQEANINARESVERRAQYRLDVEQQIQSLTEDFNKLMDERRWGEAEAIARQAYELAPNSQIVAQLTETAKFASRLRMIEELERAKELGNYVSLGPNMMRSATAMDESMPYQHGNSDDWIRKSQERLDRMGLGRYSSESERDIWNRLKNTKVQGEYNGTLSEAIDLLSSQAAVNIIFDSVALAAEGVTTNTAVDVPIREPISLQSALNVVLGTQGLVFIVEDEVIKVTSREAQRKDTKPETYYVGDLVTPMRAANSPLQMNFITPSQSMNTQNSVLAQNSPFTVPNQMNAGMNGPMNATAMAQQMPNSPFGGFGYGGNDGGSQRGTPMYTTMGGGQIGGVTEADFDNLIDLIKSTISPDDWDDTNGDGSIQAFVPNLSLIVSQTQEVQDQIQDLLERLRELNDVQIVVEVRFVTLADNFFERIGIDFDFRLNDNTGLNPNALPDEVNQSVIIGRSPGTEPGFAPTGDLDVAFDQSSFGAAIPTFGNFAAASAANFGFAILSDIEVFFLIQASKGDTRSNITQAPTVTMFNGQSASVNDGAQRPFVTSVVPVVGDFAVAHQPVISLLPDGTSLNVQATASADRRFVRLSLVPFFSQVTDVETFTFDGSRTTRRASDNLLEDLLNQVGGGNPNDLEELEVIEDGVTIQLPVVSFTTINTVVSVPDGGTVLMGGIKRMSEGRTESGVPFLSNVPYINRLFKNVGIGRTTSNLMMMVTPRIIIQDEEERFQVGPIGGN